MNSHCKTDITVKVKREREEHGGKIRKLADAIMLQAIEDLWIPKEREKCINFFTGEEFNICAGMSGMNFHDKVKVLNLVGNIFRQNAETEVRIPDTLEKKKSQSMPDAALM
ncbi:MAG: hypothetical protein ABSB95_16190 [Dissulfurispiraceae bacterium]|jgi:hypothetical protein